MDMDGMGVSIVLRRDAIKPDEFMTFRVTALYRGRQYHYDLIEKHDMVSSVFDRMVERARIEMKKMIVTELAEIKKEKEAENGKSQDQA